MDRVKVDVLVILPLWTTQSWWPQMLLRLVSVPLVLDFSKYNSTTSSISRPKTSTVSEDQTLGLSLIRRRLESRGIQNKSASVILSAWRSASKNTLGSGYSFVNGKKKMDCLYPTEKVLLEFLTCLFNAGASYSAINSARSAIAANLVDKRTSIGEAPLVQKFVRGVFNVRPQLPRYTSTWDVNIVLNYLRSLAPSKLLSLKQLTLKTTVFCFPRNGDRP